MTAADLDALAAILRGRQADLIRSVGSRIDVAQVGGAVLADPFPMPCPGPAEPVSVAASAGEATIETFVANDAGPIEAMGDDEDVARWWQPAVGGLTARVRDAVEPLGVRIVGPIYITASATSLDNVIAEPHLDDDQYHPDTGVGLVAIAASHCGPRLARGALRCARAQPGAPLGLDQDVLDAWFDGPGRSVQATDAHRIVLFPRFGQLHAGPVIGAKPGTSEIRNLLVLRADTAPVRPAEPTGPTGPTGSTGQPTGQR